jgi:serine/threonine protein kinase
VSNEACRAFGTSLLICVTRENEYARLLRSKNLWPVKPDLEQNWSGRGEHLELTGSDKDFLDRTLALYGLLGQSNSAIVERVKCRRIMLARKTISCSPHFTKQQAIEEVAHLKKLHHTHIVRVIGTYVLGKKLSILIYPVARYSLDGFLEVMESESLPGAELACRRFFSCLSSALDHIHSIFMKHMDIKPRNILVHMLQAYVPQPYLGQPSSSYQVLIADFGIARSYNELNDTNTDGPTMFTRKYAAPEVVVQQERGLHADIFSLGCVFLEMIAALGGGSPRLSKKRLTEAKKPIILTTEALETHLDVSPTPSSAYHANVTTIRDEMSPEGSWLLCGGPLNKTRMAHIIRSMMDEDPKARPSANQVLDHFGSHDCCKAVSVELEAHKP